MSGLELPDPNIALCLKIDNLQLANKINEFMQTLSESIKDFDYSQYPVKYFQITLFQAKIKHSEIYSLRIKLINILQNLEPIELTFIKFVLIERNVIGLCPDPTSETTAILKRIQKHLIDFLGKKQTNSVRPEDKVRLINGLWNENRNFLPNAFFYRHNKKIPTNLFKKISVQQRFRLTVEMNTILLLDLNKARKNKNVDLITDSSDSVFAIQLGERKTTTTN